MGVELPLAIYLLSILPSLLSGVASALTTCLGAQPFNLPPVCHFFVCLLRGGGAWGVGGLGDGGRGLRGISWVINFSPEASGSSRRRLAFLHMED